MYMTSETIMQFPDGRTQTSNVLSCFEKNGTNIIVFGTDKVENGHKVTGVAYFSDGMYQNIIDSTKWDEVRGYLVDILHDRMPNEDYRTVPSTVLVTADPYRQLALRDENLEKIISSYESFKTTVQNNNISTEQLNTENQTLNPEMQASTSDIVQSTEVIPDAPVIQEMSKAIPHSEVVMPQESVNIGEIPSIQPVQPIEAILDAPVTQEMPEVIPQPEVVMSQESVNIEEVPSIQPVQPSEVIPDAPVAQEIPQIISQPELVVSQEEASLENNQEESAVEQSYKTKISEIKESGIQATNEYIAKIQAAHQEYLKKMDEMEEEIIRNLEEAKGINDLSKQTFEMQ